MLYKSRILLLLLFVYFSFLEWSREVLLEEWITNPKECCEKSGVKPPEDLEHLVRDHTLTTVENEPEPPAVAAQDEEEVSIALGIRLKYGV